MSTEQNQSESQGAPEPVSTFSGPAEANGNPNQNSGQPGQPAAGQGRFRRRRRRKRNAQGGANPAGTISAGAENSADGQPVTAMDGQQRPQQGQPGLPGEGRRRRKKKGKRFSQPGQQAGPGNRQQTHQPGNTFGGGGRRQKKGRGGRQFVGPMDHSYMGANGNYSDGPPSTIALNGNRAGRSFTRNAHLHDTGHQSQFLPTVYEPKPPAIAEDAPVRVYCFIEDLFITAKISETARKLGVKVAFVKGEKEDLAKITDAPEDERANLILLDLNNANAKPLAVVPKLRAKLKKSVSIIGFVAQVQGDLKSKAIEAGYDTVMPRAAFSQALPNLLRRYGLAEDIESQDSQHAYFS